MGIFGSDDQNQDGNNDFGNDNHGAVMDDLAAQPADDPTPIPQADEPAHHDQPHHDPPHHQPSHHQQDDRGGIGDLADIKQQALKELSPLVSHLDQSPEEKFHTTMMMLQATDDQGLIKNAFEAAQAIQDDKAKAQALLDVINEINYFSHGKN